MTGLNNAIGDMFVNYYKLADENIKMHKEIERLLAELKSRADTIDALKLLVEDYESKIRSSSISSVNTTTN